MRKLTIALAVASVLGVSSVALADANSQGFYAGTNLGYSSVDIPGSWSDTDGFGYNFHGGYMFNRNFGADLGYTKYADAKEGDIKYKTYSIDMAAKGVYNINSLWSVFGKAGLASVHAEVAGDSTTKVKPLIGLGAGYTLNKNTVINAGWSYVMGGDSVGDVGNLSLAYVGIDYHF